MICNRCGMQNNEDAKFCIGCGNGLQQAVINDFNNMIQPNINQNLSSNEVVIQQTINNPVVQNDVQKKEKKPLNKKMILIIGAALLAIIVIVLLLVLGGNKNSKLSNIFDLNTPIPVRKDGMYVYIDTNGKIIKNVKYYQAGDFKGDYAFVELEDGTAALIDKNQNVKVKATSYYGMEYLSEYNLWLIDGTLYNSNLKAITDNSIDLQYEENGFFTYNNADYTEYGIINSKGKKIYKNNCLITSLEVNDNSYESEYYGILKTTCHQNEEEIENEYLIELQSGKILYENEYKKLYPDSYYYNLYGTSNNIFYIYDNSYNRIKYFYLNDNKIIYSSTEILNRLELYGNEYLELDYGYDYEKLGKEQRYYYYNLKTKKLEKEEPEKEEINIKIEKDVTERQIVSCKNGKGLIDDKKVIIPCVYENIEYLNESVHEYMLQVKSMDLMIVEDDNNEISIYDANDKKEIIKFEDSKKSDIVDYENSLLIKQKIYVSDSSYSDIDRLVIHNLLTREKIVFDAKSDIEIKSNYFIESKNGKKFYYNMNFEKIYTEN